nr:Ig-like domain-containing protein [Lachnospiraceae bacterium]
ESSSESCSETNASESETTLSSDAAEAVSENSVSSDEVNETEDSTETLSENETDSSEETSVSESTGDVSLDSSGDVEVNSSVTWSGATEITTSGTYPSGTYSTSTSNQNALLVNGNGINVTLSNPTATKSGSGSSGDNANFYGIDSAILAKGGANVTITGANVTTTAAGGNGIFSYGGNGGQNGASGDGTTVTITDSTISTSGSNAGGIMTTGGGVTVANNLTINTTGGSSAPIRTDRGGGTVTVNGGSYTSSGLGSPAIYSTADVTVNDATLTSNLSEGVCIEGKNSITLNNCTLTASNTKKNGHANYYDTVMIYQSMSGDADSGTSAFNMTGGTLNSKNGYVFHVTNTAAVVNLSGVTINNTDSGNVLFDVSDDGWSGSANSATLNASGQTLEGKIQAIGSSTSSLTLNLKDSSTFNGMMNNGISDRGSVAVVIESGSIWTLTGDSYVTSLSNSGTVDCGNYTLYVNGTAYSGSGSSSSGSSSSSSSGSSSSSSSSTGTSDETGSTETAGENIAVSGSTLTAKRMNIKSAFSSISGTKRYYSSDKSIATVTVKGGWLIAKKSGTVTITCKVKSGKTWVEAGTASYNIVVPTASKVTNGTAHYTGQVIDINDYINNDSSYSPTSWKMTGKTTVATLDTSTGKLTIGQKSGTVKVYAYYGSGTYVRRLAFTVKVKLPALSSKKLTVKTNKTKKLRLKYCTESITWTSSDTSVATVSAVDNLAYITGVSKGTAVITAQPANGPSYTCTVTVK